MSVPTSGRESDDPSSTTTTERDAQQSGPRPASKLILGRRFGTYFWANLVANSGVWGVNVAAVVVVLDITDSAQMVGLVTVVQFLAPLLLAPVGGMLADRFDPRKILVVTHLVSASALIGLASLFALSSPAHVGAGPILATCFVLGVCLAITDPSRHSIVPRLVEPVDVGTAVSLNTVTFNIGRAVGPGVAGILLSFLAPAKVFAIAAGTYLLFAAVVLLLRPRDRSATSSTSIFGGLKHVLAHRKLLWLLVGVTAAGFATDPIITLVPLLVRDILTDADRAVGLTTEPLAVGLLASSFGVGAVSMAVFVTRLHRRWGYPSCGTRGLLLLAAALLTLTLAPAVVIAMPIVFVGGCGYLLALTSFTASLQTSIPDALRGRIMALWGVCFLGSRPISAWIDSTVAHLTAPRTALCVGVVVAASAALAIRRTQPRAQDHP